MVVGGEDKCTSARRHRKNYTRQRDRSCSGAPTFNKWCESDDYCHQLLSASESVLLIKWQQVGGPFDGVASPDADRQRAIVRGLHDRRAFHRRSEQR